MALKEALDADLHTTRYFKYTHPQGRPALLEALVEKLQRDNGMQVSTEQLQVVCGGTQGLAAVAQTVLDPGDEVILFSPHWPLIRGIVTSVGGRYLEVPFELAAAEPEATLEPLCTERTKAIYLANPNNPDGRVLTAAEAEALYRFAARRGLMIWSDEAYEHSVFDGLERSSLGALDTQSGEGRVLSVFTFSKSFGMAGMRCGYVVGPKPVMDSLKRVCNHQIYNLSDLNQGAALAALVQPPQVYRDFLQQQRQAYEQARDLLLQGFPGLEPPQGGAYLFVPFTSAEESWDQLHRWMEEGLCSAPGEAFGSLHPNYLRLCFTAVPPSVLEQALEIIARCRC